MKALKYLTALWIAAAVYTFLSVFTGDMGFSAHRELEEERTRQEANLETLKAINRQLAGDMEALLYDPDTAAVYARDLGYGRGDERFVRIVGLGGLRKQRTDPGRLVSPLYPGAVSHKTIRLISLLAAALTLGLLSLIGVLRKRSARRRMT